MLDAGFYKGKKILITGHTGFKGTWLCQVLLNMGADITGYAMEAPTKPSLFEICHMDKKIESILGDIRDLHSLKKAFSDVKPELVIHMAAQPIVRKSYQDPVYTYDVNVMGTVNVLDCIRTSGCVRSFLNVTTDKVYKNREWEWGYRENEELNGFDPYSNSKSCSEIITDSYRNSFLEATYTAVSTARAGNVIGGGDFAEDRIIPDCVRAVKEEREIIVRNPNSIRPYQHVLDPIIAYLLILQEQYKDKIFEGNYNIGPSEENCWTTSQVVNTFCSKWETLTGKKALWKTQCEKGPHEAAYLKLDCSKMRNTFNWESCWDMETAIEKVVEWSAIYLNGDNIVKCIEQQINNYMNMAKKTKVPI